MRNTNRALAAAAVGALAALILSAAPALAQPDVPNVPDPTTCSDALTDLVKVRTTENGLGARVTVLEQEDKIAAKALHSAQQADKTARDKRDAAIAAAQATYINGKPYHGQHPAAKIGNETQEQADARVDAAADAAALAIRNQKIADANSEYQAGGTAVALTNAQHEYNRHHSALLDVRAHLGGVHNDVVRITIIIGKLCNQTPPPPPVETTTETPAPPVDTTPPAPVNNGPIIVNNPQIGQVPTGSNTGGGAEAANVE